MVPSAVGRHAHCKKCRTRFRIVSDPQVDDDTIFAWITSDDPSSASVMGSTGMFPQAETGPAGPEPPSVEAPVSHSHHPAPPVVKLTRIDTEGAHFEFPATALTHEPLRNSFPRKCAGCGTRNDLHVHLIYWRDRMPASDALTWQARQDASMGRLIGFEHPHGPALLKELPHARGVPAPFNLPFPVFTCEHCRASREVRGRVVNQDDREVCQLTIASLAIAVDFFRDNGGRHTPEYHRLIEERDQHPDAWRALEGRIRQRIAQWFTPRDDERFLGFFRDAEFSPLEAGGSGMVLTSRRLVFKKYAACREYPLDGTGRIEITPRGGQAAIHIYDRGERPAIVKLESPAAEDLAGQLRRLHCKWTVVSR
ncbi:MAG: hypothetical protein AMXMBFR83_00980 [Phycisphaerae bacterium]